GARRGVVSRSGLHLDGVRVRRSWRLPARRRAMPRTPGIVPPSLARVIQDRTRYAFWGVDNPVCCPPSGAWWMEKATSTLQYGNQSGAPLAGWPGYVVDPVCRVDSCCVLSAEGCHGGCKKRHPPTTWQSAWRTAGGLAGILVDPVRRVDSCCVLSAEGCHGGC